MSERSLESDRVGPVLRFTGDIHLTIFAVRGYLERARAVYVEIEVRHVKFAGNVLTMGNDRVRRDTQHVCNLFVAQSAHYLDQDVFLPVA